MSYILDALRRADSERERGAVPSIHSPPVPPLADDPRPPRGSQSLVLVGVIVVLLLALAGLLAWHLMSGKGTAPVVVAEPAPAADQPAEEAPPVQAAAPAVPTPVPAPPAQRPSPPPQASVGATPILSVPPRPALAPRVAISATPATPATPAPTPAPTAEADTRIYTPSELPANLQRDLPKLVIGGAMYSETPANRMLIINSQVFHEGDKLTSDLVLQEIRLKSAVLKYKGYRYGVSY
ncbi:general secretion pathway protein GspB [Aquabacterium sp.]|uniref:general secretion pathway protein GspB n=1 Tax=Aquabacterium sp. TaxID=1872578 RepID=UPI0024883160|nr:general secretion pathway protein GspB [Aquabacterium sp.]MDI1259932.1 general secretion pathway protein GspB [Aquabacterium sp.]